MKEDGDVESWVVEMQREEKSREDFIQPGQLLTLGVFLPEKQASSMGAACAHGEAVISETPEQSPVILRESHFSKLRSEKESFDFVAAQGLTCVAMSASRGASQDDRGPPYFR